MYFWCNETEYLGYISRFDIPQVHAIGNCKRPGTVQDLWMFLGTWIYYRRQITKAAGQQAPLNDLLCQPKNKDIIWSTEADEACYWCILYGSRSSIWTEARRQMVVYFVIRTKKLRTHTRSRTRCYLLEFADFVVNRNRLVYVFHQNTDNLLRCKVGHSLYCVIYNQGWTHPRRIEHHRTLKLSLRIEQATDSELEGLPLSNSMPLKLSPMLLDNHSNYCGTSNAVIRPFVPETLH